MNNNIISPFHDPMGAAINDYFNTGNADRLVVLSDDFDEDEIPVAHLFRTQDEMSRLELTALKMAKGRILDVGAGSGCHSIALQQAGHDVTALEISTLSAQVMTRRGVANVVNTSLFDPDFNGSYDTVLMLMNGSGIIGRLKNMDAFFSRMKELLAPGGVIIMDSSDLRYLYEDEDGSCLIDLAAGYYGEISYSMSYKGIKGDPFDWLYIDLDTLSHYAALSGFKTVLIETGEHYDYLAALSLE